MLDPFGTWELGFAAQVMQENVICDAISTGTGEVGIKSLVSIRLFEVGDGYFDYPITRNPRCTKQAE